MKFYLICAGFILCFRSTRAETCLCVTYLISENGLLKENRMAYIAQILGDTRCDGDHIVKCKDLCIQVVDIWTNGYTTCSKFPSGLLVGDWMCQALNRNVCDERVGLFAESCGSDLLDTGIRFKERLCCKSGKSKHC
ncbi:uncharacterized protein [Parasteatoda tepidariorum]|uniref:uncharacterized protein n=1 Tax=Parasteatoda tepidariorum TaxID=114398 RepID=UPI00077F99C2|nr:uncharacterized protein LOC107450827 [Parasteatoda tepidariorum]